MILLIDNYDSFTYNLVQYIGEVVGVDHDLCVARNDKLTIGDVFELKPDSIVISPGPCTPNEAGISLDVVQHFAGQIPMLGVCLGHQSIAQALGGRIVRATSILHGKQSQIFHADSGLFHGLPQGFWATRYHSLIVEKESLPADFSVSAWTAAGEIMALEHQRFPGLFGIQFHPESFLTEHGKLLLKRFSEIRIVKQQMHAA